MAALTPEAVVPGPQALVLVTTSFPTSRDGSEAAGGFVEDLARVLAVRVPVRVVAPGRESRVEVLAPGIEVHRFAAPANALSTLRPWHPADLLTILRVLRSGQRATRAAVAAGPTFHVLALWALPCGAWARQAAAKAGLPYSVWTLGSDIWSLGRIPVVRSVLAKVLSDARRCYSDGVQLRDETERLAGRGVDFLPSTRAMGFGRVAHPRARPPYRLVFIGRWHPNKGVDLLLEALATLGDGDWRLIERVDVYGGGPLEDIVATRVAGLRAAGRPVARHGFIDKSGAEAALASCDYLLLPSRIESIPVVFSDAMKTRCPVVATPVGDLPALMRNGERCGFVSSAIGAEAYAEAIRNALRTPANSFEDDLADMASMFDLDACAMRLLEELAGGDEGGH